MTITRRLSWGAATFIVTIVVALSGWWAAKRSDVKQEGKVEQSSIDWKARVDDQLMSTSKKILDVENEISIVTTQGVRNEEAITALTVRVETLRATTEKLSATIDRNQAEQHMDLMKLIEMLNRSRGGSGGAVMSAPLGPAAYTPSR